MTDEKREQTSVQGHWDIYQWCSEQLTIPCEKTPNLCSYIFVFLLIYNTSLRFSKHQIWTLHLTLWTCNWIAENRGICNIRHNLTWGVRRSLTSSYLIRLHTHFLRVVHWLILPFQKKMPSQLTFTWKAGKETTSNLYTKKTKIFYSCFINITATLCLVH